MQTINYRNISQLNEAVIKGIHKIPYDIDLVVGIPRSGIIPANLIALYRNVPFVTLTEFVSGLLFSGGERLKNCNENSIKKVLIVDDSLWSGKALSICKEKIAGLSYNFQYIFAAVYIIPESIDLIDIYLEILPIPRVFQWNIMHHSCISKACIDMDGVLCLDPTEEENDDGVSYQEFLLNAKPLFIPTVEIDTIVSCRLEKYRELTEKWLEKHNVKYKNLILLDLPNKESRIKWNKYGEYKASVFLQTNCNLFIESSLSQAKTIARISERSVFCIDNFQMILPQINIMKKIKRKIKKMICF